MARAYANRSVLFIALAAAACRPANGSVAFVDLLEGLPRAERRAALPVDVAIRADLAGPAGDLRPAIITAAPARVTWSTRLPSSAQLEMAVMLTTDDQGAPGGGATARVGISDDRRYEQLAAMSLGAAQPRVWQAVTIDLGAYSGWQWSLFYRPREKTWRLIFSADATPGGTIAWARPVIRSKP